MDQPYIKMNFKTITLVSLTLLETLLFGGLLTGWSSQVYVLKEDGLFEDFCDYQLNNSKIRVDTKSETSTDITNATTVRTMESNVTTKHLCKEQDTQLNLFFSVALALSNISIVFIGIADNRLGTKITRLIFMIFFTIGSVLLAFTSKETPWLLLPGLYLIAIGGFSLLLTNVHVSFILSRGSAVYIGLLNGCFDSSAAVQWIIKVLYEAGVGLRYSYITIAILSVMIVSVTTILHPVSKDNNKDIEETGQIRQTDEIKHPPSANESDPVSQAGVQIQETSYTKEKDVDKTKDATEQEGVTNKSIIIPMHVLHVAWFTINSLKCFYFIGSINYRLEVTLNDHNEVGYFTDVLAYITFGGICMSFVAGSISEWQKHIFIDRSGIQKRLMPQILPLCLCSLLTILISVLEFSTDPNLLYIMFVLVVMLRGFVFAINMGFIASVFPEVYVTFLLGLTSTIGGALSMIQYALFAWNKSYPEAPIYVSGFFLALGIISLIHPLNVYRIAKLVKNQPSDKPS